MHLGLQECFLLPLLYFENNGWPAYRIVITDVFSQCLADILKILCTFNTPFEVAMLAFKAQRPQTYERTKLQNEVWIVLQKVMFGL